MVPLHEGQILSSAQQFRRDDWESATMYFALIDRFSNGNPLNDRPLNRDDVLPANDYHGGDVEGVQQRLENGFFSIPRIQHHLALAPAPQSARSMGPLDQRGRLHALLWLPRLLAHKHLAS